MDAPALIRRARRQAGMTQAKLAERLGVTQPVVARLERGGSNPSVATLERIAAATGHSLRLDLDPPFVIDESMLGADLRSTPNDRLRSFESFYAFAKEAGSTFAKRDGS